MSLLTNWKKFSQAVLNLSFLRMCLTISFLTAARGDVQWLGAWVFCKLALQIWGKLSWIYYRLIQDLLPPYTEGKIMHVDDTGID